MAVVSIAPPVPQKGSIVLEMSKIEAREIAEALADAPKSRCAFEIRRRLRELSLSG
jgi:hypothetical protein